MGINVLSKPGLMEFSYHRVFSCRRVTFAVNEVSNLTVFLLFFFFSDFKTIKYNSNGGGF